MSLYEFDDGHLIPTQFGRPTTRELSAEHLRAVRSHVLELVGRPLFPVLWEEGDDARLLALDAAGATVTVEVLRELNATTLVAALTRAGHSAALGWLDLAARYPKGDQAFRSDWNEFRQALPPRITPGPRIVLVANRITDDLRPALEMLAGSGVEAHQLQLRDFGDGRQLLDIVAVRGPLAQRSQAVIGHQPRVAITLEAGRDVAAIGQVRTQEQREDLQLPATPVVQEETPRAAPAPEVQLPPPPTVPTPSGNQADPAPSEQHQAAGVQSQPTPPCAESANGGEEEARHADAQMPRSEQVDISGVGLREIAAYVGDAITLVWLQDEQRYEAILHPDGTIALADGAIFHDPTAAARAASGREDVDGWQAWHFGADGASLFDARSELAEFQ